MPRLGKAEGIAPKRTPVRAPAGSSDPAWDPPLEELRAGLPAGDVEEAAKARSRPVPEPGERGGFASLSNRGERRGFALVSIRAKQEGSPSCEAARWGLRVSAHNPADGKRRSVRAPCATHGSRTRFRLAPEPTHPAGDRPASAARSGVWDFGGWRRRRPPCCLGGAAAISASQSSQASSGMELGIRGFGAGRSSWPNPTQPSTPTPSPTPNPTP
jgi:hypothetical protein